MAYFKVHYPSFYPEGLRTTKKLSIDIASPRGRELCNFESRCFHLLYMEIVYNRHVLVSLYATLFECPENTSRLDTLHFEVTD
jgi:hypothetical protein